MKHARDWSQKLFASKDFFEVHPLARERVDDALEQIHLE